MKTTTHVPNIAATLDIYFQNVLQKDPGSQEVPAKNLEKQDKQKLSPGPPPLMVMFFCLKIPPAEKKDSFVLVILVQSLCGSQGDSDNMGSSFGDPFLTGHMTHRLPCAVDLI